jgi:hypothetical protein
MSKSMSDDKETWIAHRPISDIPGDWYLKLVLRQWRDNEWVVHVYNEQDGGYYHGRYFDSFAAALYEFVRVDEWLVLSMTLIPDAVLSLHCRLRTEEEADKEMERLRKEHPGRTWMILLNKK